MIDVLDFVEWVERIAQRRLTYRIGGVGKDGTCDCIGLIMGAMYELGHAKYALHSTNYFARQQTMELKRGSGKELFIGQILYRARESTEKLNARYLPGGRYYTGDMLDYYHVGVVTSIKPLRIIECTQYGSVSGIVVHDRFSCWNYGGKLRGVSYEENMAETVHEREERAAMYNATVITKLGALNIREWPKDGTVVGKVPKGATVQVLADAGDGWPKVSYGDVVGYASEEYLHANVNVETLLPENTLDATGAITIIDSEGHKFTPIGDFRVIFGSLD